jgi:hypothetical protein
MPIAPAGLRSVPSSGPRLTAVPRDRDDDAGEPPTTVDLMPPLEPPVASPRSDVRELMHRPAPPRPAARPPRLMVPPMPPPLPVPPDEEPPTALHDAAPLLAALVEPPPWLVPPPVVPPPPPELLPVSVVASPLMEAVPLAAASEVDAWDALVPLGRSSGGNFPARFACEGEEIPALTASSTSRHDRSHFVPSALAPPRFSTRLRAVAFFAGFLGTALVERLRSFGGYLAAEWARASAQARRG